MKNIPCLNCGAPIECDGTIGNQLYKAWACGSTLEVTRCKSVGQKIVDRLKRFSENHGGIKECG